MKKLLFSIFCFFITNSIASATDVEIVYLKEASPPDKEVFAAVKQTIEEYKNKLQWKEKCSLNINFEHGIIETNWHPVHKGEVSRKIQLFVWGKLYRVDVWHSAPLRILKPKKDYMARLTEMRLQARIEEILNR